MQIFTSINDIYINKPTVVLLGKFDGMHKGHRKLFECARQIKKEHNTDIAVFTMQFPYEKTGVLSSTAEKRAYFEAEGTDYVVECEFDDIKDITAKDFIADIVLDKLKGSTLVAGWDCSFGKNREGDANKARLLMSMAGGHFEMLDKEYDENGCVISSSYIKECLRNGLFDKALKMLSHPYAFTGRVLHGNHIGKSLNFPTINIDITANKVLPAYGVYASRVCIGGTSFAGISNLGVKPTVGTYTPSLETYVLDFDEDIYGEDITVELTGFIRHEQKFESLTALKKQISEDVEIRKQLGELIF